MITVVWQKFQTQSVYPRFIDAIRAGLEYDDPQAVVFRDGEPLGTIGHLADEMRKLVGPRES